MIWSISWKNVWRNRIRSLVVMIAVTIGMFGGIFLSALWNGMVEDRVRSLINNEISHIQIHDPEYPENNEIKFTIENYKPIENKISQIQEVEGVSSRLKLFGMANSSSSALGVMINGIDPENEKKVTHIHQCMIDGGGDYFESGGRKPILIGSKLARTLKLVYYQITEEDIAALEEKNVDQELVDALKPFIGERFRNENKLDNALEESMGNDYDYQTEQIIKNEVVKYNLRRKIVLQFLGADGYLTGGAFKIAGIYKTTNSAFDEMNVFVLNSDLYPLTGIDESATHEIAIRLQNTPQAKEVKAKIAAIAGNNLTEAWYDLNPEIEYMSAMMDFFNLFFIIIILLAMGFGIVNTMMMVVLERVKEIGMLMAIGMNKVRVFWMIMLETIFLTTIGAGIGMSLSYFIISWTNKVGLDMTAMVQDGFEALGYSAIFHPEISWDFFIQVTILVIITAVLASVFPARRALKLKPVDAIRSE